MEAVADLIRSGPIRPGSFALSHIYVLAPVAKQPALDTV